MRYVVNSKEMKLYDNNTTEHFSIPSLVLMERAALAFCDALHKEHVDASHTLIVCGGGNNGADGLAIARLLLLEKNEVDVVSVSSGRISKENEIQQNIFKSYGGNICDAIPEKAYTLVVDAIFGIGLSRNVEGDYLAAINRINEMTGYKAAVDISSGISSDNGSVLGCAFRADLTVTFSYEKVGQLLWPGAEYSGHVTVKQIGIDDNSFLKRLPGISVYERSDLALLPERIPHSNKGTYGKLLIIAGSVNMAGAAILSARAAYAMGTGLVRVLTCEENRIIIQTALPEAILTVYQSKKPDIDMINDALAWADAIVCGPGLGTSDAAVKIVKAVLKSAAVPVLYDADALNIISQDTAVLMRPHTDIAVTPHLKEMSRLCGDSVSYIQSNIVDVASEFARQYNVVCVLKDSRTVTSVPYSGTYINVSGNDGMATAGSGDVLSGIIGALMARGMSCDKAAPLGVYVHGLSGDAAREEYGRMAMTASDLIEGIASVSLMTEA